MKPIGPCALALGTCLLAAVSAPAQTASPGRYLATPSWDQKLACGTAATCPRFTVLSNWNDEAVLDRETGLVWQRTPTVSDQRLWLDVELYCLTVATGGRFGWRLPSVAEMGSLLRPAGTRYSIELPPGNPFLGVSGSFWTSTTYSADATQAYQVSFPPGPGYVGTIHNSSKDSLAGYWCVRGPE